MNVGSTGGAPVRVLVLDAEKMVVDAIQAFFDVETNYEVIGVCCPLMALAHLREHPVDVLVADLEQSGMPPERFIVAAREISADLPLVLLTGCLNGPSESTMAWLRPACCLPKPWSNTELWGRIEAVAKLRGRRVSSIPPSC